MDEHRRAVGMISYWSHSIPTEDPSMSQFHPTQGQMGMYHQHQAGSVFAQQLPSSHQGGGYYDEYYCRTGLFGSHGSMSLVPDYPTANTGMIGDKTHESNNNLNRMHDESSLAAILNGLS